MTPALTDNSTITRPRAPIIGVCVAQTSDNTSVITRYHAAYTFLCDTSIIVKYRTGSINDKE